MAAGFENRTIGEIRDLLTNSFHTAFNKRFRVLPKSFIKIIATVFAGVFVVLHKQIGWLFLQLFPETAYWGNVNILGTNIRPLVRWGTLIGVGEPRTGSQWKGSVSVSVLRTGTVLLAGTQLKSDVTEKLYITEEGIELEGDTASVRVICAESGIAGNLETGDTLYFVFPLGIVEKTVSVNGITAYATEDETETQYRERVVNRFRNPPMGGALSDYRRWASDVPGVLNVYPYKDVDSPSGVLVFVAGIPSVFADRIPTVDLLRQVGRACTYDPETGKATRRPITAVIDPGYDESYRNVKAVTVTAFDVYIDGISGVPVSDFGDAVKRSVENYFAGREPYIRGLSDDNNKTNIVSKNNVSGVIDQTAISLKAEFSGVSMRLGGALAASHTLGMGELAKLGDLYLNEGLYA